MAGVHCGYSLRPEDTYCYMSETSYKTAVNKRQIPNKAKNIIYIQNKLKP